MYKQSYSKTVQGITCEQIWAIWSDIAKRPLWDDDTQWAHIKGAFAAGNIFIFKPKGGPRLKMTITECTPNKSFTDCFKCPGARLYGTHELEPCSNGLSITTTITVKGPLRWILQKIIAEKIVATLPHQTDLLIKCARGIT